MFILVRLVCWAEGAWLDGWSRRAPITVTGSTVGAQTNYQVKREVTYDADMQGDFDDIRFTSSDGITLLDYWLEVSTPSIAATFWIEVPSIPVSPGTSSIYIYYGNPSIGSDADGGNTFILFDDFEYQDADADTALWTPRYEVGGSLGSADIGITESGKLRTYQGKADVAELTKWYAVHGDGQQLPADFAAEVEWQIVGGMDSVSNSFEVRNVSQLTGTTGFVEIGRSYYYTGAGVYGIHMSQDDANFYSVINYAMTGKFRFRKEVNIIYGDYDVGDGWVNLGNYSIAYDSYIGFSEKSWVYTMMSSAECRWDNLFVRKYISPEPLVGIIGSEENGNSSTMFTNFSGADKTVYNVTEDIYVTVTDLDENTNPLSQQTVIVTITNSLTGDSETITLIETGNDTGVFRNTSGVPMNINPVGIPGNNELEVIGGENINVGYTDNDDGGDSSGDIANLTDSTLPQTPIVSLTSFSGGTTMKKDERAIVNGSTELEVSIYNVVVKDQQENVLSEGITTQVNINALGEISGYVDLGSLEVYPLVKAIKVEIIVEEGSGNRSSAGVSNYVRIASGINKITPYNNLFNPKKGEGCQIKIELIENTHVTVKLYTLVGDLVKVLVDEDKQTGTEIIYWYGKNNFGDEVASGTYLLRIEAGSFKDTKKICIIK